jgi:hypothetical protein
MKFNLYSGFIARISFAAMMICCNLLPLRAQNPVLLECMNINKTYTNTPYLSFNTRYKYSFESTPTVIEDSSFGVYKVNQYKYWGQIDSVEFMQNDSFAITLFREERTMALGTANYKFNQTLPLAYWDSLFLQNERFSYATGVDAGLKKITVNYNAGLPYKKFEMWYDSVNYRISRIRYVISEYASEPDFYSLPSPGQYGIVDMEFYNYQTGLFSDNVFRTASYVLALGNNTYSPATAYSTYQLYISAPGLKAEQIVQ